MDWTQTVVPTKCHNLHRKLKWMFNSDVVWWTQRKENGIIFHLFPIEFAINKHMEIARYLIIAPFLWPPLSSVPSLFLSHILLSSTEYLRTTLVSYPFLSCPLAFCSKFSLSFVVFLWDDNNNRKYPNV